MTYDLHARSAHPLAYRIAPPFSSPVVPHRGMSNSGEGRNPAGGLHERRSLEGLDSGEGRNDRGERVPVSGRLRKETRMTGILTIIGAIVVLIFVLKMLGLY